MCHLALIFSTTVQVYDGSGCQKRSALDATNTPVNDEVKDLQSHDISPISRQKEHSKRSNATQPAEQHGIDFRATRPELRVRSGNYNEIAVNDMEVTENDMEVAENGMGVVGNGMEFAGNEMEMPANRIEDAVAARSEDLDDPGSGGGLMELAEVVNGGLLPEPNIVRGKVLSKRRAVTESEVMRALQAAQALELSNPNILIVMRSTHVYKSFLLVSSFKMTVLIRMLSSWFGLYSDKKFKFLMLPSNSDGLLINFAWKLFIFCDKSIIG